MENKPSLFNASNHLLYLMEQIDDGVDLTDELISDFETARTDIADAIDRRKFVMTDADARIAAAKKIIDDARSYVKKLENLKAKIKESTKQSLLSNPDYTFKDTLGRKISLRKTPGKVKYIFPTHSTSVSNCVDPLLANDQTIQPYLKQKTYYVVDTEAVKAILSQGFDLPFAELVKSETVKGLD